MPLTDETHTHTGTDIYIPLSVWTWNLRVSLVTPPHTHRHTQTHTHTRLSPSISGIHLAVKQLLSLRCSESRGKALTPPFPGLSSPSIFLSFSYPSLCDSYCTPPYLEQSRPVTFKPSGFLSTSSFFKKALSTCHDIKNIQSLSQEILMSCVMNCYQSPPFLYCRCINLNSFSNAWGINIAYNQQVFEELLSVRHLVKCWDTKRLSHSVSACRVLEMDEHMSTVIWKHTSQSCTVLGRKIGKVYSKR